MFRLLVGIWFGGFFGLSRLLCGKRKEGVQVNGLFPTGFQNIYQYNISVPISICLPIVLSPMY